jgi:hypothetical protein|tara:strand:- start:1220 stop:1465 length:246 start_codon:yes stop_codon:yes gene_type:complete
MIEHFTALVLSYHIQQHQISTVVWFETEEDCQKVMQYKLADPLYDQLYELYGNDIEMYCEPSQYRSKTIRPKLRPQQMEKN